MLEHRGQKRLLTGSGEDVAKQYVQNGTLKGSPLVSSDRHLGKDKLAKIGRRDQTQEKHFDYP